MKQLIPITYVYGEENLIKQAALLTDYVFPWPSLDLPETILKIALPSDYRSHQEDYKKLIDSVADYEISEALSGVEDPDLRSTLGSLGILHFNYSKALMSVYDNCSEKAKKMLREEIEEGGHLSEVIKLGYEPRFILSNPYLLSPHATVNDITTIISGIELIDTSKASWEQILEYRKDDNAKTKLRNLRNFLQTNYEGKSLSFIEDDLGKRINDYKNTAKEYGFETVMSVLTCISNSKSLVAYCSTSLLAVLIGAPVVAAALSVGVFQELLKIGIEVVNKRHALNLFGRDSDIAYIMDFEKFTEKSGLTK
jgi:hypothetical protein